MPGFEVIVCVSGRQGVQDEDRISSGTMGQGDISRSSNKKVKEDEEGLLQGVDEEVQDHDDSVLQESLTSCNRNSDRDSNEEESPDADISVTLSQASPNFFSSGKGDSALIPPVYARRNSFTQILIDESGTPRLRAVRRNSLLRDSDERSSFSRRRGTGIAVEDRDSPLNISQLLSSSSVPLVLAPSEPPSTNSGDAVLAAVEVLKSEPVTWRSFIIGLTPDDVANQLWGIVSASTFLGGFALQLTADETVETSVLMQVSFFN